MGENATFILLSFEGPDPYSHVGGLGTRVTELSSALAAMGHQTHLYFVGDPDLPGRESRENGKLHLHRWCQWISMYHPEGVYHGEENKLSDWERTIPSALESEILESEVAAGRSVVILAEEWQTASSVIALREIVVRRGWQDQVYLLWNANNTFSFHRIDWDRLKAAATITTVSRYMKQVMGDLGVEARIIPNGIPERWTRSIDRNLNRSFSSVTRDRLTLVKVARWDPDKRWGTAVDAAAEIKRLGLRPLFLARGGEGQYETEVAARAERQGLRTAFVEQHGDEVATLVTAIRSKMAADMLFIRGYLFEEQRRALFRTANAVLANSGSEPFGLVGLETMAVGGVAFVGSTGEDYVTPGYDAISLQSNDPLEIVYNVTNLHRSTETTRRLRRAARNSAARHMWKPLIQRHLLSFLEQLGMRTTFSETPDTVQRALEE